MAKDPWWEIGGVQTILAIIFISKASTCVGHHDGKTSFCHSSYDHRNSARSGAGAARGHMKTYGWMVKFVELLDGC